MNDTTILRPGWVLLPGGTPTSNLAVVVRDGRIDSIRDLADGDLVPPPGAEVVDLPGHILMPGLANLHTHVGAGPIARGISEDFPMPPGMPFYVPLSRLWRHAYSPELREDYRAVVEWDLLGMLLTGTTTVVNHASTDVTGYLEIAARLGVRTFAGPTVPLDVTHRLGQLTDSGASRRDLTGAADQRRELDGFRELYDTWHGRNTRIEILLGPAAAHAADYAVLESVGALAAEYGCLMTTHLCQAPSELEETRRRYGRSPLRVLDSAGMVTDRLLAAHATYLPEDDLDLAAASGMTIVHCASRKAKEAVISPSVRFREAGISVALGTDGFRCDMVDEMSFAAALGKIATGSTASPTARDVVCSATETAAASLGRPDLGRIAVGATADLIAVDLSGPASGPVFDPVQSLVYYGNGRDVTMTMVGGQILVRDRVCLVSDVGDARSRAEAAMHRIWDDALRMGLLAEVIADKGTNRV